MSLVRYHMCPLRLQICIFHSHVWPFGPDMFPLHSFVCLFRYHMCPLHLQMCIFPSQMCPYLSNSALSFHIYALFLQIFLSHMCPLPRNFPHTCAFYILSSFICVALISAIVTVPLSNWAHPLNTCSLSLRDYEAFFRVCALVVHQCVLFSLFFLFVTSTLKSSHYLYLLGISLISVSLMALIFPFDNTFCLLFSR